MSSSKRSPYKLPYRHHIESDQQREMILQPGPWTDLKQAFSAPVMAHEKQTKTRCA